MLEDSQPTSVLVVVKAMITNGLLFVQHAGQALVYNGLLC